MGKGSPNHIFSIKDKRTISPTHYIVNKALDRLRFRRTSSGSDINRYSMSSIQDPKVFAKKVANHASNGTIERDWKAEDENIVDSVRVFLDAFRFLRIPEIQERIQGLKTATAPELTRADEVNELKRSLETISAVKDEQIKKIEEDKDEAIRKLETENKKLKAEARSVAQEKETVAKEKAKLEHERQAEERKYRERETKLEKKKEEALEKEKKKVKEEYQGKVKAAESRVEAAKRKLEKEKDDAIKQNKELKTEVNRLMAYRDILEERNEGLGDKVTTLQDKLRMLSAETAVSSTPFTEYKKYIADLSRLIGDFVMRFENVPKEVELIFGPLGSLGKLRQASGIFDYTSSSRTPVATSLRKAGVHNYIAGTLVSIFQNRLLIRLSTDSSGEHDEAILSTICAALSRDEEQVWRGITVKALDKLPRFSGITQTVDQAVKEAVDMLQPLIQYDEQAIASAREQVAEIIKAALKIWSLRRNDRCTITINSTPGLKNDDSWNVWTVDEDSVIPPFSFPGSDVNDINGNGNGNNNGSESPTHTTFQSFAIHQKPQSYVIFPQIIGEFDANNDKRSDLGKKSNIRQREILHPGIALFSNSLMFDMGLQDIRSLKDDAHGLQHRRRMTSISSSTTIPNNSTANNS
ncbi:hypothetical protein I7I48_04578 [Histoplasma ohiense]|nr:hypothetical protein I7I48_04578 [Histoplasma ohiense (nom. inval.)]